MIVEVYITTNSTLLFLSGEEKAMCEADKEKDRKRDRGQTERQRGISRGREIDERGKYNEHRGRNRKISRKLKAE